MMGIKQALKFVSFIAMLTSGLAGCAAFPASEEALSKANRALELSEMCNQRMDRLMEIHDGK